MLNRIAVLIIILAFALPASAASITLLSPFQECTLSNGRVRLVGLASGAEKGKVQFDGRNTSFRIKDGAFSTTVNLPAGVHELKLIVGEKTTTLTLTIDPEAKGALYSYHTEMEDGECTACHEKGAEPIAYDTDLSTVCGRCHSADFSARHVHGPVAMGMCSSCHDPHGSTFESFLRMEQADLCIDCHNQPITAGHRERAGEDACMKCHDPHESEKRFLIK
jgi:predicted CXXCH cytochrome family protein